MLTVWRANLLGSSGKGHEYFLRHLLGTDDAVRADEAAPDARPREVTWRPSAPEGKLDLLLALDFRMTSTTMFADVVLPAATWYEKHDLSSTDLHPYVHAFNPAIAPPWQTRTDFAAFAAIGRAFSTLAATHLGVRRDLVAAPLLHDTADELATAHGIVRDWRAGECPPVPGVNLPRLVVVERDYPAVADRMAALGPLAERLGATTKGVRYDLTDEVAYLGRRNGLVRGGAAAGRPSLARDTDMCEAILAMSGTTNGARRRRRLRGAAEAHRRAARRPGRRPPAPPGDVRGHPGRGRCRWVPRRSGPGSRPAGGATPRSRSTSSGPSPGTPSPAGSISSSTTTGWPRWASRCRSTVRRWT